VSARNTNTSYSALNIFAVRIYGESEFWLSGGKVFLITMLFFFTFVTMVGGNPAHDAFGFRNFNSPGAFAEHLSTGILGKFEGFLNALWAAAFTCVGPEYVSIVAAEAKHPRTHIKTAFKNVYWRQVLFFGGGALAVGVLVPYNDPTLVSFFGVNSSKNSGAAGASPYIIAMGNLGIDVLPHIATALLATTIFSAGNTYSYCATRTLHSLALEGRAPKFLRKCSKRGIPYICFGIVMLFPLLAFMQMSNSAAQVLNWLITLATAATIIDYVVISITYLRFYYACKKQGFDRSQLPYTGWMQPYCGWLGLVWMSLIVLFFGYASFKPWNSVTFFTTYTLVILYPFLYLGWKFFKGTKVIPLAELDLVWRAPAVTAYEESAPDRPIGFWREVTLLFFSKVKKIKNVKKKSFV
jgi:amino acid transporter